MVVCCPRTCVRQLWDLAVCALCPVPVLAPLSRGPLTHGGIIRACIHHNKPYINLDRPVCRVRACWLARRRSERRRSTCQRSLSIPANSYILHDEATYQLQHQKTPCKQGQPSVLMWVASPPGTPLVPLLVLWGLFKAFLLGYAAFLYRVLRFDSSHRGQRFSRAANLLQSDLGENMP